MKTTNDENQRVWNVDLTRRDASRYFWTAIAAFTIIGTFLPILCGWNYREDVLEQVAIGREWVLGSFKHPALTTWLVEILRIATFRAEFAPYLASTLCISATLWATWATARNFMSERLALLAGLSPILLRYFSTQSQNYNNNVTLCAFWALSIWAFHRSLTLNRRRDWILTGVFLCGALLSKYAAALLVATFVAYLFGDKKARAYWKTSGPYLTTATAFVLFSPHLLFYLEHREALQRYAVTTRCPWSEFPLEFVESWFKQIGVFAPILVALAPLVAWQALKIGKKEAIRTTLRENDFDRGFSKRFLIGIFVLPFIFQAIVSIANALPVRTRHATHLYPLLGTVVLYYLPLILNEKKWKLSRLLLIGIATAMIGSNFVQAASSYFISAKASHRYLPLKEAAATVDALWDARFGDVRRATVAGDQRLSWSFAVYDPDEPNLVLPEIGAWAQDEKVERLGGIVVWSPEENASNEIPEPYKTRFPNAEFVRILELKYRQKNPNVPSYRVGFAFVAPPKANEK